MTAADQEEPRAERRVQHNRRRDDEVRERVERWQTIVYSIGLTTVIWSIWGDYYTASYFKIGRYSSPVTFWVPFLCMFLLPVIPRICKMRAETAHDVAKRIGYVAILAAVAVGWSLR